MTDYELERQPVVERFQEAARASATWFEDVGRYDGLDPVQFAFNLLTRSGRIGHLELTKRDARFVATVDRLFAGTPAALVPPPPLRTPLRQRALTIPNRVALAVVGEDDAGGGRLAEAAERRHLEAAAAGVGVVASELVAVAPDGRVTPGTPGLWEEGHAEAWQRLAAAARRHGARLAVRLGHAGRRGATRPRRQGVDRPLAGGAWPLLAASAVAYRQGAVPRAMDRADMDRVTGDFARAARLAAAAGVEVLLLDLAHGYLLGGFLSPLANLRDDEFGGPLEGRLRFPLEVVDAVRAAWPRERPLWAAVAASDAAPGGIVPQEAVQLAVALAGHGCDLLQVTAGQATAAGHPEYGRFYLVGWSDLVRNEAAVPTMVGGNLTTADEVDTVIAAGRADLCLLDPRYYL